MGELILERTGAALAVRWGEHGATLALDALPSVEVLTSDAHAYGRALFDALLPTPALREAISSLSRHDRLALVTGDDPALASIPWEYLRDLAGELIAARVPFVRALPEARRKPPMTFGGTLEVLAAPASPVDDARPLNTEAEWQRLRKVALDSGRALRLTRIRPPELGRLSRALGGGQTSIVWFMGHSTAVDGERRALPEAHLVFEDSRGQSTLVSARKLVNVLDDSVLLVVLNSCLSAMAYARTEFANVARSIVSSGVPYALGMQFAVPDDGAVALSETLLDYLLKGRDIEDAVRRTRADLEQATHLAYPSAWLAGIPVLYTNQREALPGITLAEGPPQITPSDAQMARMDIGALPAARHFVGRQAEISRVLDALQQPKPPDFVVLHGLGGAGKTALARAVAERIGWRYDDHAFAHSFELFAQFDDTGTPTVSAGFVANFLDHLARFLELDPAEIDQQRKDMKQEILRAQRGQTRLLILDNIETLVDAQLKGNGEAKALAAFVSRLREGPGAIVVATRSVPAEDWGSRVVIEVPGLTPDAGAQLFRSELSEARRIQALPPASRRLSTRLHGHPLSIRLLAGSFQRLDCDLDTYLTQIEDELTAAELSTPNSLDDPARQATLYACLRYSEKRLSDGQREALRACAIFRAPFTAQIAGGVIEDTEHAEEQVNELAKLGWLERSELGTREGVLVRYEPHAMVRWYSWRYLTVNRYRLFRYAKAIDAFAQTNALEIDRSILTSLLIRGMLPDLEAASEFLGEFLFVHDKYRLTYNHARFLQRFGQTDKALNLLETIAQHFETLDLNLRVATQNTMAEILVQRGEIDKAVALYKQGIEVRHLDGDLKGLAMGQNKLGDALFRRGRVDDALDLYQQALETRQKLDDMYGVAVTQARIAQIYLTRGQLDESFELYQRSLDVMEQLDDIKHIAVLQHSLADIHYRRGQLEQALILYQKALKTKEQLGDVEQIAVTQHALAAVYSKLGQTNEAIRLYELSLHTDEMLGNRYGVAITLDELAELYSEIGQYEKALQLYESAVENWSSLDDIERWATTKLHIAGTYAETRRSDDALATYYEVLNTVQYELPELEVITKLLMSNLLYKLERYSDAMQNLWQAWTTNSSVHSVDNQTISGLLMRIRQSLGDSKFLTEWETRISDPVPQWLYKKPVDSHDVTTDKQVEIIVTKTDDKDEREAKGVNLRKNEDVATHPMIIAVQAYLQADSIQTVSDVFAQYQDTLFMPEVEENLKQNIARLHHEGKKSNAATIENALILLQLIKREGVSKTLARIGSGENIWARPNEETIHLIVKNTSAVLGSVTERHSEWRDMLVAERNTASLKSMNGYVDLLDAVIALLDAGGDATGLGVGLITPYEQVWLDIVGQLGGRNYSEQEK